MLTLQVFLCQMSVVINSDYPRSYFWNNEWFPWLLFWVIKCGSESAAKCSALVHLHTLHHVFDSTAIIHCKLVSQYCRVITCRLCKIIIILIEKLYHYIGLTPCPEQIFPLEPIGQLLMFSDAIGRHFLSKHIIDGPHGVPSSTYPMSVSSSKSIWAPL